jgi:hypothetical protein
MADLTAARRNKLPAKSFGEPGERKYPMPNRSHAANAKARAKQQLDKGNLSRGEYDKIVGKANRKLGETKEVNDYIAKRYGRNKGS